MKIFLTLLVSLACCLSMSAQSKNAEKAFNKGLDYFQEQAYAEALDQFKSVIWADPDHEAAHHFLAQIYTAEGKNTFAIKHLKRVLAINSDREDSWVDLSKAYALNAQSEKAIATLEKAVKINPNFHSAKSELETMLNPPVLTEPEIIEDAIAYELTEMEIQPPAEAHMVSINDEPSLLLAQPSHSIASISKPVIIPIYDMEEEMAEMKPIQKEEVMAPAPTREKPRKTRKEKKEKAGSFEKEEMAADILNELLPAFEVDESFETVAVEEEIVESDENLTKEDLGSNVTIEAIKIEDEAEVVEEVEEEVLPIQEEIVPSYSSTPRIPGIRMPSPVDQVIKAQEEAKRSKKRKN